LSSIALAKKTRRILVECVSMAGTGRKINWIRQRTDPKAVLLRFDKDVNSQVLFVEKKKLKSIKDSF